MHAGFRLSFLRNLRFSATVSAIGILLDGGRAKSDGHSPAVCCLLLGRTAAISISWQKW